MHLVTKKEIELQKITAENILASNNPYLNKSKIVEFLQNLERINNLRFTKIKLVKIKKNNWVIELLSYWVTELWSLGKGKKGINRKGSIKLT